MPKPSKVVKSLTPDASSARSDRTTAAWIFLIGMLVLAPGVFFGIPGGKAFTGALRVVEGELPYRDFWTMYAPGQFLFSAALIQLFGKHVIVQGVVAIAFYSGCGTALFLLLRRLDTPRRCAATLALIFIGAFFYPGQDVRSYPIALLVLLVSLLCAVRALESRRGAAWFQAGLCLGVAAFFKHDVAAYIAFGLAAAILLSPRTNDKGDMLSKPRQLMALASGCALIAIPVVVWLAVATGAAAWEHLIVFPATDFRIVRGEAYPLPWPDVEPWRDWFAALDNPGKIRDVALSVRGFLLGNLPQLGYPIALLLVFAKRQTPIERDVFHIDRLLGCVAVLLARRARATEHALLLDGPSVLHPGRDRHGPPRRERAQIEASASRVRRLVCRGSTERARDGGRVDGLEPEGLANARLGRDTRRARQSRDARDLRADLQVPAGAHPRG